MRKLSVSIGIPAFNEEHNILSLLQSLIEQEDKSFVLKEIIVASDGSSDQTVEKVKSIKDSRIYLINGKTRKGKSARMNQIFQKFSSDVLILMDSDILITDRKLLTKVMKQFNGKRDGVAAVNTTPVKGENYFVRCLNYGVKMQSFMRDKWNHGHNYLSFRGCFLVLSRELAKSLKLSNSLVCNDAYLFFAALNKGYKTRYISDAVIYYRSPRTFTDHLKQSRRFQTSIDELKMYFSDEIEKAYLVPTRILYTALLTYFIKNPFYFAGYLLIYIRTRLIGKGKIESQWQIAESTKILPAI